MVSPLTGGERSASSLGLAVYRSVRDKCFPYTVPLSRIPRQSLRMRFVILGPIPVRVCTLSSGRKGGGSSQRVPQSLMTLIAPPLAGEGVVRRPSSSTDPTTSGASVVGPVVAAAPLQQVPQRRPRAEPSCVATFQRLLPKVGLFARICTSTSRLYQAKCWCLGRGVAPVNATVPVIVDFLVHLNRDKGLSASAVKDYCSALNSVFALKGMDLADSRPISMLIKSLSKSVRPEELHPSAWDVTLVLQSLTRAPYEPLWISDECFLT